MALTISSPIEIIVIAGLTTLCGQIGYMFINRDKLYKLNEDKKLAKHWIKRAKEFNDDSEWEKWKLKEIKISWQINKIIMLPLIWQCLLIGYVISLVRKYTIVHGWIWWYLLSSVILGMIWRRLLKYEPSKNNSKQIKSDL